MSEYKFIEKPFLDQLEAMGWEIVEQSGIPSDPALTFRSDFREIILKSIFKESVKKINIDDKGKEWLTERQLEDIYNELLDQPHKTLIEANRDIFNLLIGGGENRIVMDNELFGESSVAIKLIDFDNPKNNSFMAIQQFRIDTPGTAKEFIIPDIVLFVNGLPLVVIECKYATHVTSNPMEEGIRQLFRYSGRRKETEGITEKEGDERLFRFNQLMISTSGDEARFGSVTSMPSLVKQLSFIKTAVVVSGQGANEDPDITYARKDARSLNAIDSFKMKFDFDKTQHGSCHTHSVRYASYGL